MASDHKASSAVAEFDDLVHYTSILTKGDEREFIKFVKNQVGCTKKWLAAELEKIQLRESITKMRAEKDGLEVKLKHARAQVDLEMKRRMKAEAKQDELESQVALIRELLNDKNSLSDKERESLAFLDRTEPMDADTPNRHLSLIHEISGDLLDPSDISYDHTEEDLDVSYLRDGKKWKGTGSTVKRRPSAPPMEDDDSPPKRSKMDTSIVTTTVTVPSSGPITATAQIETIPNVNTRSRRRLTSKPAHNDEDDDSFWGNPDNQSLKDALNTVPVSPASRQQVSQQLRKHEFVTKTVIRPESCTPCSKKVKFGKYALKCRNCRAVCHPDCKDSVPVPCVPVANTPVKHHPTRLEEFVPSTSPQVPNLVIQCVEEIESRGMKEEGLYRLSGADKQVKELKERLVMGKDGKMDKIHDIHVVCGALKDFLRNIEEPIITFRLHENFMNAAGIPNANDSITAMYQAISELPYPNRDTLSYVILHLQRVAESKACKMPKTNLAKVFGPTIVRHNCPDPEPMQMLNDTKLQPLVVDRLLSIPSDFWKAFINIDSENRVTSSSNMISNNHTSTPNRESQTPVYYGANSRTPLQNSNKRSTRNAQSSMLGPVNTPVSTSKMGKKTPSSSSIKSRSIFSKTPLTPRFGSRSESRSTKKTTNFFSSPTLR